MERTLPVSLPGLPGLWVELVFLALAVLFPAPPVFAVLQALPLVPSEFWAEPGLWVPSVLLPAPPVFVVQALLVRAFAVLVLQALLAFTGAPQYKP